MNQLKGRHCIGIFKKPEEGEDEDKHGWRLKEWQKIGSTEVLCGFPMFLLGEWLVFVDCTLQANEQEESTGYIWSLLLQGEIMPIKVKSEHKQTQHTYR